MTPARQWGLGVVLALSTLGLSAFWLMRQLPSDEALAGRAAEVLGTTLGVQVSVGQAHWRLLPTPALVIEDVATLQPQPVKLDKLTLYPSLAALWSRRIRLDRAELDGARLPQASLRALGLAATDDVTAGPNPLLPDPWVLDDVPLMRLVWRNVQWVSRTAIAVKIDGDADFDALWRPAQARLWLPEAKVATDMNVVRDGQDDRWTVTTHLGGGTADGALRLAVQPNGRLHLSGELKPTGVEVSTALQSFNRRPLLSGRASGTTVVTANGLHAAELAQSLHTQTRFTMGAGQLLGFDLDKAVRSLGQAHDGQTQLQALTGQLDTQNTAGGMVMEFSQLKASASALTVSGKARLLIRQLDAELAIDLVDGVVGVPLKINGPLDRLKVSVPPGALAGAAVGSVVLPGIGTAVGARLGAALGNLFGKTPEAAQPAPSKTPR